MGVALSPPMAIPRWWFVAHLFLPVAHSAASGPARNPDWKPLWQNQGSYDAVMCEGTPFWWPVDQRMYLMECVCKGPLDRPGWGNRFGYYWGHAEQWLPE